MSAWAAVAGHLRGRAALVVLDNCEHLVAACAAVAEALLGACPGLRVLATSREPLGVGGETVWRVPSLAAPDQERLPPPDELAGYAAVRLFADRAAAASPAPTLEPAGVLDALAGLVDKSLVVAEDRGEEERYRLLETVRAYALEQLGGHEDAAACRDRHAAHYLALGERAEPELLGRALGPFRAWCDRLEREHDNLRAALRRYAATGRTEPGLRLAGALGRWWDFRGLVGEGCAWLELLLAQPGAGPTVARAQALFWAGWLAHTGDHERKRRLYAESLEIGRARGDGRTVARALAALGTEHAARDDAAAAGSLVEEGLAVGRRAGDAWSVFWCLLARARVASSGGDHAAAHARLAEARAFARGIGTWLVADTFLWEGLLTMEEGDAAAAGVLLRQALAVFRDWGVLPGVAHALLGLGVVALLEGDRPLARTTLGECLALQQRMGGDTQTLPRTLRAVAALAVADGRPIRAARLFGAAEKLASRTPPPFLPYRSAARAALGGDTFETARAEGEALPLEEAIAEASGELTLRAAAP